MGREAREIGLFGAWWIWVALLLLITSVGFTTVRYLATPHWRNMETTGIRESNEFVQSKLTLLQKLDGDCTKLQADVAGLSQHPGNDELIAAKRAQMRALDDQIRAERSYLPMDRQPAVRGCGA